MSNPLTRRRSTWDDLTQRVRRHRPSELLPEIAVTALEYGPQEVWIRDRLRLPWSLAAAAKVSLVHGNEHRRSGVTQRDVAEICQAFNTIEDPLAPDADDPTTTVTAFMVRTEHEQFRWQMSMFEEISRLTALFESLDALSLKVIDYSLLERIMGCSLGDFTTTGFALWVGAENNGGFFDPDWPSLAALEPHISRARLREVLEIHFLYDFAQFRAAAAEAAQPNRDLRRHEFNPLTSRPFVTLPDGRHVAPQPKLVIQKLSPSTLYYAGLSKLNGKDKSAFTEDFGIIFEHYVGRQLALLTGTVTPEVVCGHNQKSVDWFVVFEDAVLLVEAKSTRLTQPARMGGPKLADDVQRCLGKAFEQIANTESLVRNSHGAFSHIPDDRRHIGLVVTLEPYPTSNTDALRASLPDPTVPTLVGSIRELEHLVNVVSQYGVGRLTSIVDDDDRRQWNLGVALGSADLPKNPILDAAWSSLPVAHL